MIRLPFNHRSISLLRDSRLSSCVVIILEHQRSPVSTELRVSSISVFGNNVMRGINGSLKFSNTSLCTCHNLLTPEALHILTKSDASVLTSVGVKPLVDLNCISKLSAMPVLRSCELPTACTILCVRFTCFVREFKPSATSATLDMGGWLNLSQQGLTPCKMHQD